jgi:hypothetical protein
MYKNATKCNETIGKWCKNKHGASKIIDTFETYHGAASPWSQSSMKEVQVGEYLLALDYHTPPIVLHRQYVACTPDA